MTTSTKPTKGSHLCETKGRAKDIVLYKFNIFVITTIKHVVTVTQVYVSIDNVGIIIIVAVVLCLILSTPITVYRCQFKPLSFNKQLNLEINKTCTTGYVSCMKRTLTIKMRNVHNNKYTTTTILFVKMHKTHSFKLSKIRIEIPTMACNLQKTITHNKFFKHFFN